MILDGFYTLVAGYEQQFNMMLVTLLQPGNEVALSKKAGSIKKNRGDWSSSIVEQYPQLIHK